MPDLVITQPDGSSTTVSSDLDKAEALNSFFAQQTHLQDSPSSFPTSRLHRSSHQNHFLPHLPRFSTPSKDSSPVRPLAQTIFCPACFSCALVGYLLVWLLCLTGASRRVLFPWLGRRSLLSPCTKVIPKAPHQTTGQSLFSAKLVRSWRRLSCSASGLSLTLFSLPNNLASGSTMGQLFNSCASSRVVQLP